MWLGAFRVPQLVTDDGPRQPQGRVLSYISFSTRYLSWYPWRLSLAHTQKWKCPHVTCECLQGAARPHAACQSTQTCCGLISVTHDKSFYLHGASWSGLSDQCNFSVSEILLSTHIPATALDGAAPQRLLFLFFFFSKYWFQETVITRKK